MRNLKLCEWQWIASLQYHDGSDSLLHISTSDAPDILTALAIVQRHVIHDRYTEIISLTQSPFKN